jgi:hypothetical protein
MAPVFLLDPAYGKLLESTACRRRFAQLHLDTFAQVIKFIIASLGFLIPSAAGLIYLTTRSENALLTFAMSSNCAIFALLLVVQFSWVPDWIRYWRLRRLAWHGELREGVLLVARRVRVPATDEDDSDYVAVEVEYRVVTPRGKRVQGMSRFRRDDLLNAELPAAGTPVLVLVLNEKTHAML